MASFIFWFPRFVKYWFVFDDVGSNFNLDPNSITVDIYDVLIHNIFYSFADWERVYNVMVDLDTDVISSSWLI